MLSRGDVMYYKERHYFFYTPSVKKKGSKILYKKKLSKFFYSLNSFHFKYLAAGDSQTSIALAYRVSKSTVCNVLSEVCQTIWECLSKKHLKPPSSDNEWAAVERGFSEMWNLC